MLLCDGKEQKAVNSSDQNTPILLVDGSNFLYRAYYGLRPLHTSKGVPVQAVYSFCRMLKKLLDTFPGCCIALVWDTKGKTARHELYSDYKATRQQAPSDLFSQKELIKKCADLVGIAQIEQEGAEADDLMYSLARDFTAQSENVILVTTDKDLCQTLLFGARVLDPFKDKLIDTATFTQDRGFGPDRLTLYLSLLGDASDNIPGVPGIGKKTATQLAQQFASLEDLYAHLDAVTPERIRFLLQEHAQDAWLSQKLVQLQYYELHKKREDLSCDRTQWDKAAPLFKELEFTSLLNTIQEHPQEKKIPLSQAQGYTFITVLTTEQLQEIVRLAQQEKILAVDVELDGLSPLESTIVGLCLCVKKGTAYYVPCGHKEAVPQLALSQILSLLDPVLRDPNIKKIMHHAKYDQLALLHYNQPVENLHFDTLVAAHLVTQDWQKMGLKALSAYYLHEPMLTFSEVTAANKSKNFSHVPLDLATEYAAADAHQTLALYPLMQEELRQHNMEALYYDIELPLVALLRDMEAQGIFLDCAILEQLNQEVERDINIIKEEIIALSGVTPGVNLNSPKQIEQLLFEHLKLPPQKKSTKKTGFSTDVDVLQALSKIHPVPALLLQYRELFKLKSTYIDALPKYVSPRTGKIHTNFSQISVATGRLSSSDPNLQNIPTSSGYALNVRSAFKPSPGHLFLSADYSQIELRILAYFSQDPSLVAAFSGDQDIHTLTAAHLFEVAPDEVTSEQRKVGKRINFSIVYGSSAYGLSQDLDIPFKQAKQYIEKYFKEYARLSAWMESVVEQTKKDGYVTTWYGRRRYVPGIYEHNKVLYEAAKRIAINTQVQGTDAEIVKKGMLAVERALRQQGLHAKLLLQIHDELLFEVPVVEKEATEPLVKQVLETVVDWNVPLQVSTRWGSDWQEVTK